jgi:hypothetical protein
MEEKSLHRRIAKDLFTARTGGATQAIDGSGLRSWRQIGPKSLTTVKWREMDHCYKEASSPRIAATG